jgi:hypothetical protein
MNYTMKDFGKELKDKIYLKQPTEELGAWAYSIYFNNMLEIDDNFREVLLTLNKMELGPEFAYSYEELEKIADDLIAGRKVKL